MEDAGPKHSGNASATVKRTTAFPVDMGESAESVWMVNARDWIWMELIRFPMDFRILMKYDGLNLFEWILMDFDRFEWILMDFLMDFFMDCWWI